MVMAIDEALATAAEGNYPPIYPVEIVYTRDPAADHILGTVKTAVRVHANYSRLNTNDGILVFVAHREEFDIIRRKIEEKLRTKKIVRWDLIVLPLFFDDGERTSIGYSMSRLGVPSEREGGEQKIRKLYITATEDEDEDIIVCHSAPESIRCVVDCGRSEEESGKLRLINKYDTDLRQGLLSERGPGGQWYCVYIKNVY